MTNKCIDEIREALDTDKTTSGELFNESRDKAIKYQKEYNSFVTILDKKEELDSDSVIRDIPYALKDNISTKGILTTASSNILKDYIPLYDATVYRKLKEAGAVLVGKTVLDELAMGGTGTTGHTGVVHNPWSLKRMTSGSSAGSAASVACGCYPFALGSDTGDSIRKPAAYCGIVGYKPTYGMISRYGLFPFACSLDTVGVLSRSVKDSAIAVDAMKGIDSKDMTSWDSSDIKLYDSITGDVKNKKLFYIKEIVDLSNYDNPSDELKSHLENFNKTVKLCKSLGMSVEEVSIDRNLLNAIPSVYVVISCAEATSNMSNLTGISFGPRGEGSSPREIMKDHRTKGFSPLIKRRFVIGSFVLQKENQEKYFINAKRVRRLIVDKMNELFDKYDALILPVGSGPAKYIEGSENNLSSSNSVLEDHLQIGNFGGFPSITIPNGFVNKLPVAVNITGKVKDDISVLNIAYALESNMEYKNQLAKEVE